MLCLSCPTEWTDTMGNSSTCCREGETASHARHSSSRVVSTGRPQVYCSWHACIIPIVIHSSPNLTAVLGAFSFVIVAEFRSLSQQVETLLSMYVVSFPSWGMVRLNYLKPWKSQPSHFSTRKMWIAQLHPLGSLSQLALQPIAISYWPEFMYFHVTHYSLA